MKRSEMIHIIADTVEGYDPNGNQLYDAILNAIEETGMLPPYRYQDEPLATRSNKLYHRVWDREDGKNDWESEDET